MGERLQGGWASAGEAGRPPLARLWGSTAQLLINPVTWSKSLHPMNCRLEMGRLHLTRSVVGRCGRDVPSDMLVSLPDQQCFVKGSCYHHQPLLWGNLLLVTGLSVWLSPFTSLSVHGHLTQNFHHNASRASGEGGGCRHSSPTTVEHWAPGLPLLSASPTHPLLSRAQVGCYLVTLLL